MDAVLIIFMDSSYYIHLRKEIEFTVEFYVLIQGWNVIVGLEEGPATVNQAAPDVPLLPDTFEVLRPLGWNGR